MHRLAVTSFLVVLFNAGAYSQPGPGSFIDGSCSNKVLFASTGRPFSSASYADTSIDVTYYRLNLRVWLAPSSIAGSVLIKARCTADTVRTIGLDLMNTMDVDSVIAAGTRLSYVQFPEILLLTLDRPYLRNAMLTIQVFYHGTPNASGFGSFEFGAHQGTPWVWTLSEPYGARDWWPCKDHPTDKADSVDVLVTCDAGLRVGSNGKLIGVTDNGDGTTTTHWAERYPIATYLVSIALTNFSQFSNWWHYTSGDSLQILNYVLPEHLADAETSLSKTIGMIDIFSRMYGLYPFINEKYGHSEFGGGGAMEHQTMTSTTSFDETVIAHELSHQWFGDLITCGSWQNLWLNEGFASYSEAVYHEQKYGIAAYWNQISARMSKALDAPGTLFIQDTSVVKTLFDDRLVYSKGASVLHMLRHVLGDSAFFHAMRTYVQDTTLRYHTAVTEDFQRDCEQASGKSLGYFFEEWIYGENFPRYTYEWSAARSGSGYMVTLRIDQVTNTYNPSFFTMPIDIRLSGQGWDTTIVLLNSMNHQLFSLQSLRLPDAVGLDPDSWILREILPTNAPLPVAFDLSQNFPNPFNGGTKIRYSLLHRRQVSLKVYTILGQEVATLVDALAGPGTLTSSWDGTSRNGTLLPSGIYFCRLVTEEFSATRKMVILR